MKNILLGLILLTVTALSSVTTLYETEPNDTPPQANHFSGEITLTGMIKKGDQDAYMWNISEEDSMYDWDLELVGAPDGMTRVDLLNIIFTKNGKEVEDYHKYFSFGTRSGSKPIHLNDLLLEKGNYLLAITSNVNHEKNYKLIIKKKRKSNNLIEKSSKKLAKIISHGESERFYHYLFKNPEAWFYFNIDKKNKSWSVKGITTIGKTAKLYLYNENDELIAEANSSRYGKFKIQNLELDVGKYYIKYIGENNNTAYACKVYSVGKTIINKDEIEPNNDQESANVINYRKTIVGEIGGKDQYDYFEFSLPKGDENNLFDLKLTANSKDIDMRLMDSLGRILQNKYFDSNYTMPTLGLEAGKSYFLYIYNSSESQPYSLNFVNFRDFNTSIKDIEPNDEEKDSVAVDIGSRISGNFTGYEYDTYRFVVNKQNTFLSIKIKGDNLTRFAILKGGKRIIELGISEDNTLGIKNLFLKPGTYLCRVLGKNCQYTLDINESSIKDLNISSFDEIEHEPNEGENQTNTLYFDKNIKGLFETKENEDYFHFTLNNYEHIRLTATPPKDGDSRIKLTSESLTRRSYPEVGKVSMIEGVYPPGRYMVDLWSEKSSQKFYNLKLERLNFFSAIDFEPNDNRARANILEKAFRIYGFTARDDDFYRFPKYMTHETNVTVCGENLKDNIEIYPNSKDNYIDLKWDKEKKTYTFLLKTPNKAYFKIRYDTGIYDYNLTYSEYNKTTIDALPVILNTKIEQDTIASYSEKGQKVNAILSIANESEEDINLNLDSHISDRSWTLVYDKNITIVAGEKKDINITCIAPKNLSNESVFITLKVANEKREYKTTSFKIKTKETANIVNAYEDWGVPKELLGGLNVARLDFGAKRVPQHEETKEGRVPDVGRGYQYLFDGDVYSDGLCLYDSRKTVDDNVTIELAGVNPCMVTGVVLNHTPDNAKQYLLKNFSISISKDNINYKKVLSESMSDEEKNQYFIFDKPYLAKYVKLTLHDNQDYKSKGEINLGEWKVISLADSIELENELNIADPKLGGHVVYASKRISHNWDREILTSKKDFHTPKHMKVKDNPIYWVVGFKNERIAKITKMKWKEIEDIDNENIIKEVKVLISTQTPMGPWIEMPKWVKSDANDSVYTFRKPTWARYVKFEIPDIKKRRDMAFPEELQIFEMKPSIEYRSILGEWGEKSHKSYYEFLNKKDENKSLIIIGNESKEKAYKLDTNRSINGRVSIANHEEDWFKIDVLDGQNTLTLSLSNKTNVEVSYELFDSNGTIVLSKEEKINPLKHIYLFDVNKGEYYLKITQPPISVVFAWDNSGSVSPYHSQIFDAVNNYVNTIQKDIEAVNLLCFNRNDRMLLDDFSNEPLKIEQIFNDFDQSCSDSDIERPLRISAKALKGRKGTKGVIIVGDAVGSRDVELWKELQEVKPKVFSIRVLSQAHDNEMYEGVMQSWSMLNNGTYNVVRNGIEMYKAINEASAILRRPVYYTVNIVNSYERPLGKGSLKIVQPKKVKVNKDFAIELILDASGSMLKRIDGKRRISIARDVLKKAVKEVIPPKTLIALRAFGHKKADSCRTDLEMRLQPLNLKKTIKIISKINAKNLAKTPIAASLAKVANDLKNAKGKKVVILVTDGEETCDGDPSKEIRKLKDAGFDIRINIVGFAIDNEALKIQFKEWAALGDGEYFEANDKKSLNAAVKKALQIPYKVYNKKGDEVAKGIIGDDSIRLKGGTYKVIVESSPKRVFEDVKIVGEQQKVLELKEYK